LEVVPAGGLVGLGLVSGSVLAFFVGKLIQSQLYGVGPADPVTFGSIALLVVLVGIAASLAPARRAASVDPVKALRSE
jgi:putative ABC transport system permease protein